MSVLYENNRAKQLLDDVEVVAWHLWFFCTSKMILEKGTVYQNSVFLFLRIEELNILKYVYCYRPRMKYEGR